MKTAAWMKVQYSIASSYRDSPLLCEFVKDEDLETQDEHHSFHSTLPEQNTVITDGLQRGSHTVPAGLLSNTYLLERDTTR